MSMAHRLASRYVIEVTVPESETQASVAANGENGQAKFEIEICKLPRLKNLHGLKFKRLGGTAAEYKDACEKLLANLQI